MEHIDALGSRPDRHSAFSQSMLSEIEDEELSIIVAEAAKGLSTPIALVNLVLEEAQFFKAHYGLPPELQASRATSRDVSFCQFVVRDGKAFEVNNAQNDFRVPQRLVQRYGIQSYLGVPVHANDIVVGSLCVIDVKPRTFTAEDRESLKKLAKLVDQRLALLSQNRSRYDIHLLEKSASPALREMQEAIGPIHTEISSSHLALAEVKAFLRLSNYAFSGGDPSLDVLRDSLKTAWKALDQCESHLYNIDMSSEDIWDALNALEHVISPSEKTNLEEVAVSGRELARGNAKLIGGVSLPDINFNPYIATPRPLAVSLISNGISMLASKMLMLQQTEGIVMNISSQKTHAGISLHAPQLPNIHYQEIVSTLNKSLGIEPTVRIHADDEKIQFLFAIRFSQD